MKVTFLDSTDYLVNLETGELLRYPTGRNWDKVEIYPDATLILDPTKDIKEELDIE